jgi:hypothetical protein
MNGCTQTEPQSKNCAKSEPQVSAAALAASKNELAVGFAALIYG